MAHERVIIGGKDLYIVQSHHHVLQSWAEIRRRMASAPALLTLDHHTDTDEPFYRYRFRVSSFDANEPNEVIMDALLPRMLEKLRYDDEKSVIRAIERLCNDEHIQTAIMAGILSHAFVVNLSYESYSKAGFMYLTSSDCVIGCGKNSHDDDCARARSAQVLETVYLDHELAELNAMTDKDGVPRVEDGTYVLDIDLDYFHLERAIEPRDPATFYRLVRNAAAITIATEPDYVEDCRIKGSHVTGESLLARMKQHIELALS